MSSPTPPPTLDDPAERKNRQLAHAQEVQELTMRLIRRTAAKAEQAMQDPEPEPEAPRTRTPDHILEFVRLTRALNQTMLIENRIAADDVAPSRYRAKSPDPSPTRTTNDPRRPLIVQAVHEFTKSHPNRSQRRREIERAVDRHLAADPDQTQEAIAILEITADEVDLRIDPAKLSDEILGMPPRVYYPRPGQETG